MPVKITGYTKLPEALKQLPGLSYQIALERLDKMDFTEKIGFLDTTLRSGAAKHDDEQTVVLLQMIRMVLDDHWVAEFTQREDIRNYEREHAGHNEAAKQFRKYLAALYWDLPDCQRVQNSASSADWRGSHPEATLFAAKDEIFRELLQEWTAEVTPESRHAFRRAIAMGWPLSAQYTRIRDGEDEVELKARGRYVDDKEVAERMRAMRLHLDSFGDRFKMSPDSIFAPWLNQPNVPEDIQKLLVVARAKAGGHKLAMRDVRFGSMLDSLPESALAVVGTLSQRIRRAMEAVAGINNWIGETVAYQGSEWRRKQYVVEWLQQHFTFEFIGTDTVKIDIGPRDYIDYKDAFLAAVNAVNAVRTEGELTDFRIELVVRGFLQGDEVHKTAPMLDKTWPAQTA
jgi:hypothetical protein